MLLLSMPLQRVLLLPAPHLMYFLRKERWKSLRIVSLMKRFFFSVSPRDCKQHDRARREPTVLSPWNAGPQGTPGQQSTTTSTHPQALQSSTPP